MPRAPWIDRLVGMVSPAAGVRRAEARARLAAIEAAGDIAMRYAAAQPSRRSGHWRMPGTDAAASASGQIARLRNIARDLRRNSPIAARLVHLRSTNTIGGGIRFHLTGPLPLERRQSIEAVLLGHVETTAIDADGSQNLYGLQRLMAEAIETDGEVLVRRRWRRREDGLAVPVQLQVLEADYLDDTLTETLSSGHRIVQGVEFDLIGRRVAYWLHQDHPGAMLWKGARIAPVRVPASEIAHVYIQDRPGQVRGVSPLAPVMQRLADFDEFRDARLLRLKIANLFAAFVEYSDAADPPAADGTTADGKRQVEEMFPGMVEHLPWGRRVTFNQPPQVADEAFERDTLREIAASRGVSYEALTFDLSEVNFTSSRAGFLEMNRTLEQWQWLMFIPQGMDKIGRWLTEALALADGVGADAAAVGLESVPPRREMVDPAREIPALVAGVRAGFFSRAHVIRTYGFDPAAVTAELIEDATARQADGLVLDTDPSRTNTAGTTQALAASLASRTPGD